MVNLDLSHMKSNCICCGDSDFEVSREHIFPQWLLKETNTLSNSLNWLNKKIPGKNCVIPICSECNSALGTRLEGPVHRIFTQVRNGQGFNDYDAELLIRWLWKINGMFHRMVLPEFEYAAGSCTLKERVLNPIMESRDRLTLAIALIDDSTEEFDHEPVGLDVISFFSNVLAAGVFVNIAMIVSYSLFSEQIPDSYTKYTLSRLPLLMNPNKKIFPINGFNNARLAIKVTSIIARERLLPLHDELAIELGNKFNSKSIK